MRAAMAAVAVAVAQVAWAGADGGAAPAPMPTTAQCAALGAPQRPYAFSTGEVLDFELDALGAKAGTMSMRVLPPSDGVWPVEVSVASNTFFSKIRRVRGTGTSYLWPKTLRPARYLEDAVENEVHRVADVAFRPAQRVAQLTSTIDGRRSEVPLPYGNEALDIAGAVYLMRQLPLTEGVSVCFDIYGIRRIWRVWGRVLPREDVSLPVGEFRAWHLAGEAARLDAPEARRGIHLWLSDDARRLPLAALGSIDLGAVRATLTGYARPKEKPVKAQSKADLTW